MPNIDLRTQITELSPSPLDSKNSPVEQKNDLSKIQRAYRYEGMTVYVKSEDCEYYLHNGTSDNDWVKKIIYISSQQIPLTDMLSHINLLTLRELNWERQ